MKKFIVFIIIAMVAWLYMMHVESGKIPDLSSELASKISLSGSLPQDPRYAYAIVIEPYGQLIDREGLELSKVRNRFGEAYNYEGNVLLILVKEGQAIGVAEIPRKPIDLSDGPDKIYSK